MLTVLIPRSPRNVALSVAISGASGVAGLLEPITGCLSLLFVVLFAHFFGRRFGRLAAGFASLGIAGVALASNHPPLASGSIARCAVAIAAAWLCAELVSRRPRQPGSMAGLKDEPFDEQLRQRNQTLQSISSLFPGHVWTASPDGSIEYLSPSISEYTGIEEARHCDSFRTAIHPDDLHANDQYWDALRAGNDQGDLEFRLRRIDGEYRWFLYRVKAIRNDSGGLLQWVGVGWDIHDRKIAEFLLRTEEETYRRIVDSVPACVCVGGPTGELLYVNKVGVAALGRPMEEIVGDRWMAFIHPDDVQAARQQWKACIAASEPVDIAVRMLQHDGIYRWQHLLAAPSRCQNGDVINWYLIGIGIEETIKAQQALTASEREARELLDRLPGRFATRTTDDFDFINQQILEETGTTLEGIQNFGFLNFIHPDDRDRVKEGHLRSVQEKSAHDTTYRWAERDGNYRWRHSRSVPYSNDDGSIYKWYSVTIDIDDLYRSKEVIREREVQLNWLAETVPSLLWRTDSRGRLEYVNKRTEDYTGLQLNDLIVNGWFHLVHPDDSASTIEAWQDSLGSGRPYDSVHRFRRADNTYRWFQCKGTPMRDANGNIVQWYGLGLDIDEPKRAEDRLRQTQAELARATQIATVAELSASIAHELNQPLTSVIANAQACKRWLAACPPNLSEARVSVESVVRDARSTDETMQSIRALFKRQSFQKRKRNVKDMVLEAVRLLREDETRHTADITFELPDGLPPVFVDQIQIQQVLLNLITNGIEATEISGRTPKILITASPLDDRSVLLEVIDNGSGIVGGDSIFDAFVTTKSKGMGIGLAVSRSIIEVHEGRLTAANNEGYGATFSVVLPVSRDGAAHSDVEISGAAGL